MRKYDCIAHLVRAGIEYDDAQALRRIAMTLHRWHELECGDGNNYGSWSIERIPVTRRTVKGDHSVGGVRVPVTVPKGTECKLVENASGTDGGMWAVADVSKVKGSNPHDLEHRYVFIAADDVAELPFLVHHHYMHGRGKDYTTRTRTADRETAAHKRLAAIMARYPNLAAYVQGDPRGAALFILDRATTPQPYDEYYSRGIAVGK